MNYIEEISIDEFRNNGFLWFINSILHVFGIALVVDTENNRMYPARCKFRGFSENLNTKGYKNLTKYMKENAEELLEDFDDEN